MLTIAGVAVVMDVSSMRISNGWIFCSLLAGFLYTFSGDGCSLWEYLLGAALPVAVLGWLFVFRMLGPGDIKLFCALGGVMGPGAVWRCIEFSFLSGAVLAFAILIFYGTPAERLRYFMTYLRELSEQGIRKPYYKRGFVLENFHFTVPVFMSAMLYAGGMY